MTKIKSSTTMRARWAGLGLAALAGAASAQQAQQLPTVNLGAGMHNIVAQVARTEAQRATGLMYRREMPAHEGMIFVFEQPATQCFWMRNTLIPLSTAFVDEDGTIVNIEDMAPMTENSHCSKKPVRFVLEMNQGWFAKRGFKAGTRLRGPLFKAS
jgi:uncharacterized protein